MTQEEIAAALAEVDSRSKSNTHRLDNMEQWKGTLDKLVTTMAGMQKDVEHTQGDVKEMKTDVKRLLDTPRKRWDTVWNVVITAVVSALVGAVLALIIK